MSLFQSHVHSSINGINDDTRKDHLIDYLIEFFDPQNSDEYFLIDPHLEIITSIKDPFDSGHIDDKFWSSLIATIVVYSPKDVKIKIITKETIPLDGLPPFNVPYPDNAITLSIEACSYKDGYGGYYDYSLHDRYMIKKSGEEYIGLHFGPSLEAYSKKDVLITKINIDALKQIIVNFNDVWETTIKTKGWKS